MPEHDSKTTERLTLLGAGSASYASSPDEAKLETFANAYPGRNYKITLNCPEFTSICPITFQPDFGHIVIDYTPAERCVESKSLKLYLASFRNEGGFGEAIVNRILDDLVAACSPAKASVHGRFKPRGGISIEVVATYPDE